MDGDHKQERKREKSNREGRFWTLPGHDQSRKPTARARARVKEQGLFIAKNARDGWMKLWKWTRGY